MAIQYSVAARTSQMSQLNTSIGINAVIRVYSGAVPANVAAADPAGLLVTFAGNASQFGVAASAVLTASAVANANASAGGTALSFRVFQAGGTVCVLQGTVGLSAADMIVTNTSIAAAQTCNFTSLTITAFGV